MISHQNIVKMKCYGMKNKKDEYVHSSDDDCMEFSFIQHNHPPCLLKRISKLSPKRTSKHSRILFLQILIFYAYILQFYTVHSFTTTLLPQIQTRHASKVNTPGKVEKIHPIRETRNKRISITNPKHRQNFFPYYSHNSENESIKRNSD